MPLSSSSRTQTQTKRGEWVPSIPLPFYGLRKQCACGRKFWTEEGYRAHYALVHIIDPDGGDAGIPSTGQEWRHK